MHTWRNPLPAGPLRPCVLLPDHQLLPFCNAASCYVTINYSSLLGQSTPSLSHPLPTLPCTFSFLFFFWGGWHAIFLFLILNQFSIMIRFVSFMTLIDYESLFVFLYYSHFIIFFSPHCAWPETGEEIWTFVRKSVGVTSDKRVPSDTPIFRGGREEERVLGNSIRAGWPSRSSGREAW